MLLRLLNAVMCLLFLVSCAVQINDPDPGVWIAMYGFCAIVSFAAMLGFYTILPLVSLLVLVPWFLVLMPKELGPWLQIETAREAGGLLFCIVWMIVLTLVWRSRRRKAAVESAA